MGVYEEYAKKHEEELEREIESAGEAQAERAKADVPESVLKRFDGKEKDEVLESYAELEKKFSQQGNDLGELRRSFDEYVILQSQVPDEPEPEYEPVTADELYEEPENAIARVVEKKSGDKLKELETQLQAVRTERRLAAFEAKFPEARATAKTEEFAEWLQASPYRARLAQQADNYDFEAAEELFGLYQESSGASAAAEAEVARRQQLKDATLESTGADVGEVQQKVSRREVLGAKIAAKQGNREAQHWLETNAAAIQQAYEGSTFID